MCCSSMTPKSPNFTKEEPNFNMEELGDETKRVNTSRMLIKADTSFNPLFGTFGATEELCKPYIQQFFEKDNNMEKTFEFNLKDGRKKYLQITGRRIYFAERDDALILTIKDLTSYKELEVANTVNKYKSTLLSSTSHELRNPLNGTNRFLPLAIIGMLEVLENNVSEEGKYFLKVAKNSSHHLLILINDILVLSTWLFHRITLNWKLVLSSSAIQPSI